MNRNKLIKRGASLIAVIMTAVIFIITINNQTTETLAKESLPGVQTIVENNGSYNPYIILEVVPDKANSSLGYLVGGEEPIKDGKALNDFPSDTIRTNLMTNFSVSSNFSASIFGADETEYPLNFDDTTYEESENASKIFDLKGSFEVDSDGDYVCIFHEAQYSYVSDNSVPDITYFEKYTEFQNFASTGNRYRITLSRASDMDRNFTTTDLIGDFVEGTYYPTVNKYLLNQAWSGEGSSTISQNQILVGYEGKTVYVADNDDYEYFGTIEKTSVIVSGNEISNIDCIHTYDNKYLVFDEALVYDSSMVDSDTLFTEMVDPDKISTMRFFDLEEKDDSGDFYVSSVKQIEEDNSYGYVPSTRYIAKPSGHYINVTGESVEYKTYDETTDSGLTRYNWISNYSYSSVETVKYQGGFTNHEWLKQYVFDRTKEQCSSLVIDVQTVTMDELNDYDLSKVSMIYFAGGIYTSDIIQTQVINLSKQIEDNNLPIIFNRSVYSNAINETTPKPNLEKLGVILMQSNIGDVKSTELASQWLVESYWSGLISKMKQANTTDGLNYVNQSIYIYDDTDYDTTDSIAAIPFVDCDFLTKFTDSKIASGFQVVLDEIENENFFLSVAGKEERISSDISKASAFRYIINFGNQRNVIKSQISVLEIEPCNSKKTSNADSDLEFYYDDDELKNVRTDFDGTTTTTWNNYRREWETTTIETAYSLVVDDIERQELLTKEIIAKKWAEQFNEQGKIDNIKLTITNTGEFIGKIEDLNENYDLIYLGLDTSTMNTKLNNCYHWEYRSSGEIYTGTVNWRNQQNFQKVYEPPYYNEEGWSVKTTDTVFNDTTMNGLVYYHVGDKITSTSDYFTGLLDPTKAPETGAQDYRMSGNDITVDKYWDLIEYMKAGYPVIFADGFFVENGGVVTVDTDKIDKSSYMYKVAQYVLDNTTAGNTMLGENVFTEKMLDDDTTGSGTLKKLAQYLNLSKLSITYSYIPEPYNESEDVVQYLSKINGEYVLMYEIALKNDAAVSISDTKYNCKLYIDKSVDGRYASDEEIGNLTIYEKKNGIYVEIFKNTNNQYELTAGKFYKIERRVPDGYVGVLPWKLVLSQNDNPLVRKSLSGYTAVPIPTSTRKTINVLNITDNHTLNASNQYRTTNFDFNNATVTGLLNQVTDFEIVVTSISASDYMNKVSDSSLQNSFSIDGYSTFLNDYQMLIIGFWDSYRIEAGSNLQNEAGVWAIRQYISEGRSVLFTHDSVTYNYSTTDKAYWFNLFIRDSVGMDRYGVMTKDNINDFYIIPAVNKSKATINYAFLPTVYDIPWKAGTTTGDTYTNMQGYSDFLLLRNGYFLNSIGTNYTFTSIPFASYSNYDNHNISVTKVNEGQITEYPFKIPDTFEVSNTHGQWLQLNMDTDSRDDITNDDIVVWYTISNAMSGGTDIDDYYQASLNNVRNNYYIYNRGNVTYSGVGHSFVDNETEIKLFINTMVAAYNAGISPPSILYKENTSNSAATIDKIYMPFDSSVGTGAYLDNSVDIFFDVIDTNIKSGTKSINADYYLQVKTNEAGSITKTINGEIVYLKEIDPLVVKNVSTNIPLENIHVVQDGSRYSFTLNQTDLGLTTKNNAHIWIFTDIIYTKTGENGVVITESSVAGYSKIEVVNLELFDLE